MTTALVVPDPSTSVYPVGWWEEYALPAIEAAESWEALDDMEAQLLGYISFIESKGKDSLELEKALRIVERRRGEMLGEAVHGGDRRSRDQVPRMGLDLPKQTASRYRKTARHWELIYEYLTKATRAKTVSQAAILREIVRMLNDELETPPLPDGVYNVILADPPWTYGNSGLQQYGHASFHYPQMTIQELGEMETKQVFAANSILRESEIQASRSLTKNRSEGVYTSRKRPNCRIIPISGWIGRNDSKVAQTNDSWFAENSQFDQNSGYVRC